MSPLPERSGSPLALLALALDAKQDLTVPIVIRTIPSLPVIQEQIFLIIFMASILHSFPSLYVIPDCLKMLDSLTLAIKAPTFIHSFTRLASSVVLRERWILSFAHTLPAPPFRRSVILGFIFE